MREGNRKFWWQILVVHPEHLDDTLLDADVASQNRNIRSNLSLARCIADAGGLRRRLILGDRWQALKVPTLLLWGNRDAFQSPEVGETIAARNPNFRIIRIPYVGHLPCIDDPERIVDEIEHFLASEPQPARCFYRVGDPRGAPAISAHLYGPRLVR